MTMIGEIKARNKINSGPPDPKPPRFAAAFVSILTHATKGLFTIFVLGSSETVPIMGVPIMEILLYTVTAVTATQN